MRLSLYFFRQYLPSFLFGIVLFTFVFLLDKLFDLIDLILNKGVPIQTVGRLLSLFIPTAFPLAIPMAILLACMVTLGRLSEENEITAVRAAGIPLGKALWTIPLFATLLSFSLVPFNSQIAPWINREFRAIYEKIIHSDPLIQILPNKFFSIKNIKIYANYIEEKTQTLKDLFVYQLPQGGSAGQRIFARSGKIEADDDTFRMILTAGQIQQYNPLDPTKIIHGVFKQYRITIPLNIDEKVDSLRFRNISSKDLRRMIKDNKRRGLKTSMLEAEDALRFALAFAPLCLVFIGVPLATSLRRGGKAFNIGISLVIIFAYYLTLIFGLTMAEKGRLPAHPSLWLGNVFCLAIGAFLTRRLTKR